MAHAVLKHNKSNYDSQQTEILQTRNAIPSCPAAIHCWQAAIHCWQATTHGCQLAVVVKIPVIWDGTLFFKWNKTNFVCLSEQTQTQQESV